MAKNDSDITIIEKFLDGNEESFKQLVENYKDNIFNTLYYLLGSRVSRERVEVLTMEVFLEVYNNLKNLENIRAFAIWLYQLVININNFELTRLRTAGSNEDYVNPDEEVEYLFRQNKEDFFSDSQKKYSSKEFRDLVVQAIDVLSDEPRTILVLHDISQLSYDDISSILDIPVSNIKEKTLEAKIELQKILSPD